MKKLFLMLALIALAVSVQAQSQLTTVRGKTKDGKTIKVEYYQGNVEDYVVSVKYEVVDELQGRIDKLQADLDAANKKLKSGGGSGNVTNEIKNLNAQIDALNKDLDRLQGKLVASELSNDSLTAEIGKVEKRVQELEIELAKCHSVPVGLPRPVKAPVLGLEVGVGPACVLDDIEEGWARDNHWAKKVDVYFGTARLSRSVPISIEAGIGISGIKMTASHSPYVLTENTTDVDGDSYQATYTYDARAERLSLTYLNVPIRVCFGQPVSQRLSVYTKVGVTPSVKVGSTFEGTGTYSLEGYYPQWDVTLQNIDELGFGDGKECYDGVEPELHGFVVWGNVAVGAYVPIKSFPLIVNAGLNLDIPLMGTGRAVEGMSLLCNGGKVVVPTVQVGLVLPL